MQIDSEDVSGTRRAENKGISTKNAFENFTERIDIAYIPRFKQFSHKQIDNNVKVKIYFQNRFIRHITKL